MCISDGAHRARSRRAEKTHAREVDQQRITEGFRIDDIPTLFTVQTFVTIVTRALVEKDRLH